MSISKTYDSKSAEEKWYNHWLAKGYFNSKPDNYKLKVATSSGEVDAKVVELPFYDKEKLLTK